MYIVKWRTRSGNYPAYNRVITGLNKYNSIAAAERQIKFFSRCNPDNEYYIEPA
jgi:hypothetical protein